MMDNRAPGQRAELEMEVMTSLPGNDTLPQIVENMVREMEDKKHKDFFLATKCLK